MKLPPIILLLFIHAQLFGNSNDFKVGDTLFVWADNGMLVRSQPEMNSKTIAKLNYGEKILVLEIVDREVEYEIFRSIQIQNQVFPAFTVKAKFVKINSSGSIGYVYGGLLSRLKTIDKGEEIEIYLTRVFRQLNIAEDTRPNNSDYRFKRIVYVNGAVLQQEHGNENWWSHLYLIPDITLVEAYLLINRLVSFESEYKRCIEAGSSWIETHPIKFEPNSIVLQSSAFEETHIKLEPHYVLITMSGGN